MVAEKSSIDLEGPAGANEILKAEIARRQLAEEEARLFLEITKAICEAQDLHSALEVALARVCEFTGWDLGLARLRSGDGKTLGVEAVWHSDSYDLAEFLSACRASSFTRGEGIPGRVWASRQTIWIPDLSNQSTDSYPLVLLAVKVGFKAVAAFPVFENDEIIAVLVFSTFTRREKDERQITAIATIAAQVGFALKQKRTEEELQKSEALLRRAHEQLEFQVKKRTVELTGANQELRSEIAARKRIEEQITARVRQQEAVAQLGQCALGLDDLSILIDEACILIAQTLEVEFCKVLELMPDGNSLLLRAGFGWKNGFVGQHQVSAGIHSQAGYTLLSDRPVIVQDLRTETRFSSPPLLHEHGVVSGLSVIIPGRDRPFGVLGAHSRKQRAFDTHDIHFLESAAHVLSEAVERKRAEAALREGEEQIRLALQFNQAVVAHMGEGLYAVDTQGLVTYINPVAERLFGWSSAELLGRKMHDLTHYQHPDGTPFPAEECPGLQVLQNGLVLADQDDVFIRRDETFFPVSYSAAPIRADGVTVGLVVVFRDMTARNRIEQDLERGAAWLRSLIATTQDAVLSIDRRGCVVLFNPSAERIFGYTAEEIVGRKVNELMAEPYASEHDGYIARYERTGEARAIGRIRTVTAKRKSGELFPIELSVTEIEVDQEVHYAAFIRDISEKTRLQEQLVERERLATIGTTAAKIGHELANPLNGMSLTIQLLEQRLGRQPIPPDSQVTATVQRLKNEISRLGQLAGQFRTISRRERYNFQRTLLAALIDDVVKIQRPHLAQLNIELEQHIPVDLPALELDGDKIKQAFLNLIKNAAEAMPRGGTIILEASVAQDRVVIDIKDTGAGIPLDVDAFEPFMTTKKDGTGIGLVIVRQIVIAHGGNISYQSRPGEGTTFRIELPLK